MKHFFLIFMSLICYRALGQCRATDLTALVPTPLAKARVGEYRQAKNDAIEKAFKKRQIERIAYSKKTFVSLLTAACIPKYDGMRVYFAVLPVKPTDAERPFVEAGTEGNLTLVYVPTTQETDAQDMVFHQDDNNSCWIITGDVLTPVTKEIVSPWIKVYRGKIWKTLTADIQRHAESAKTTETKSLWYLKDAVLDDAQGGLLNYLNCTDNTVDSITVSFAAFVIKINTNAQDDPFLHQMSLIIGLGSGDNKFAEDDRYLSLLWPEIKWNLEKPNLLGKVRLAPNDGNADTGSPCPPATCSGETLPLP